MSEKTKLLSIRTSPLGYSLIIRDAQTLNAEVNEEFKDYVGLMDKVTSMLQAYHIYPESLYEATLELSTREELEEKIGEKGINTLERVIDIHNGVVFLKRTIDRTKTY
jgi:hypothetical protein